MVLKDPILVFSAAERPGFSLLPRRPGTAKPASFRINLATHTAFCYNIVCYCPRAKSAYASESWQILE